MPVKVNGISCILAGGVRETTDTIGGGTYSLRGARTVDDITYRTVVAGIGSPATSVFTVRLGAGFETFIGTVTAGTPAQLTRDQILESSNANNAVSWGAGDKDVILDAPAAVFHSLQSQIDTVPVTRVKTTAFTSSGTLTTDADTLFAFVEIVGGCAAGGGTPVTSTSGAAGGGGGAGEYAKGFFTATELGASKSVSIGAGGTGVVNANGNAGGTTNFGSGLLTALGGQGGSVGIHSATNEVPGGAGGTGGTGGYFRSTGMPGGAGAVRSGAFLPLGGGGVSLLGTLGGGGRFIGFPSAALAGFDGQAGKCIVVEFLHV